MKHADSLIERILYLEGMPNLQRLGSVRLGEDPVEQLRLDLEVEREAVERFNRGIALSVELGDNGTRELLAGMLTSEEEHVDWLETQLDLVASWASSSTSASSWATEAGVGRQPPAASPPRGRRRRSSAGCRGRRGVRGRGTGAGRLGGSRSRISVSSAASSDSCSGSTGSSPRRRRSSSTLSGLTTKKNTTAATDRK